MIPFLPPYKHISPLFLAYLFLPSFPTCLISPLYLPVCIFLLVFSSSLRERACPLFLPSAPSPLTRPRLLPPSAACSRALPTGTFAKYPPHSIYFRLLILLTTLHHHSKLPLPTTMTSHIPPKITSTTANNHFHHRHYQHYHFLTATPSHRRWWNQTYILVHYQKFTM